LDTSTKRVQEERGKFFVVQKHKEVYKWDLSGGERVLKILSISSSMLKLGFVFMYAVVLMQ
jgi:hypothetical protein